MFRVDFTDEARDTYADADGPLARKIDRCVVQLQSDPRASNNAAAMTGPDAGKWRYRVGNHRVVYTIDDDREVVTIVRIAPRGSVYGR